MADPVIKWKLIEHSLSKAKGKHCILVAYQPNGGQFNKVLGFSPWYDLRDADLNGSVTWGESLYGWWNPFVGLGNLAEATDQWACMNEVAHQMKDYQMWLDAQAGALSAAFEVCAVATTGMLVDHLLLPGIQLTMAKSALAEMGGTVPWVIEKTFRLALIKALTYSRNRQKKSA